ncbi:MAG: IS1634 family transposase [Thiohalorhabdaceae bacterium]
MIRQQVASRRFGFDVERALFAMVANRACAPASKLYCHEQWLKEDTYIPGARDLELHQLYRAMDFLEANKEAIEETIYFQVADLLNLDVALVFYDTTSLHFETNAEDEWDGDGQVEGSAEAGHKDYGAPRKRGHSKNGRTDAPQVVVGLAVTRDGFPVRHWVFPGNTVDVTTVAAARRPVVDPIGETWPGWPRSRRISRAGASVAACSWATPGWSPRPTSRPCPGAAAPTCWRCRCGGGTK